MKYRKGKKYTSDKPNQYNYKREPLSQDEINALFTMLGAAPGSNDLPGEVPEELSLMIGIKNFTRDSDDNVDDETLPINKK